MKLTVVNSAIWPSRPGRYGSEVQPGFLVEGLLKAGHSVNYIAATGSVPRAHFLPIPCANGDVRLSDERKAYDWYRDEILTSDFVLDFSGTHMVTESLRWWDWNKFKGKILWVHNGNEWPSPRPPIIHDLPGAVYSEAQKAHGLSRAGKVPEWIAPKPENIHVVPYGFPAEPWVPTASPTKDYVLFLARPTKDKGIFEFLEVAKRLPERKFVMAFDMPVADHQFWGQKAIEAAKTIPNVKYVPLEGSLELQVKLLQNAECVLAPLDKGYCEGFGLTNGQSLACGTPVVTANHGAPPEIFTPETGILCPAGDVDAYVAALGKVETLSREACRKLVLEKFSIERWVQNLMNLYDKLVMPQ